VAKILIADDEPAIRHMLRRAFEALSWKVWEAEDGEQALSMALLERFDLVISDYSMPKLNGRSLLNQCRARFPKLPFIIISGSFRDGIEGLEGVFFLRKPFRLEHLRELIQRIMPPKYSLLS
jgi:CheY-like chemotaxis protein